MIKKFGWSPTIALSWLWGLGFFYSIHITSTWGWKGFAAFAIPNVGGLFLFGLVLDYFLPRKDLEQTFSDLFERSWLGLIVYQIVAVAITVFGVWTCLLGVGTGSLVSTALVAFLLLVSVLQARLQLKRLKYLHSVYLLIGVICALSTLHYVPSHWGSSLHEGPPLWSLVVPMLIGLILGPWLDIQQWHRAVQIRKDGGSLSVSYGAGSLIFGALISINALLAAKAGNYSEWINWDFGGIGDSTHAVSYSLLGGSRAGVGFYLFSIWACIAMITTIDSSWLSSRWIWNYWKSKSNNPLLTFIPQSLLKTPAWIVGAGVLLALVAQQHNASLLDLMAPFGTLFVGIELMVLLWVMFRKEFAQSNTTIVAGLASILLFAIGYYGLQSWLILLSPLVALIPVCNFNLNPFLNVDSSNQAFLPKVEEPSEPSKNLAATNHEKRAGTETLGEVAYSGGVVQPKGWFDGEWFNFSYVPTYGDTNSVGNVYWANYMQWIGKAREHFFAMCMPNFDLKTTKFLILTNEILHKFRSETKEFEPVLVRIRIGAYDRKFASLEHEIRSFHDGKMAGIIGKGRQKLMFVDSQNYRLVDIPSEVLLSFINYIPKDVAQEI